MSHARSSHSRLSTQPKPGVCRAALHAFPKWAALALALIALPAIQTISAAPASAPAGRMQIGNRIVFGGSIREVAADPASARANQASLSGVQLDAIDLNRLVTVEVTLGLRQQSELHTQLGLGREISAADLSAKHLPLAADVDAVSNWLDTRGLKILSRDAHGLAIFARGTVAQIQAAFETKFARVTHEGTNYLAAVAAPSVPASLSAVSAVLGLQPYLRQKPFFHAPAGPQPATSNAPPYLVKEILGAYGGKNTTLTGANQKIGIIIDVPPLSADLTAFWTANGISQSLSRITTEDVSTAGTTPDDRSGEETLDVSWSSGIAPAASVKVFATGSLSFVNTDNAYSQIGAKLKAGTEPGLHQISLSYGADEDALPSDQLSADAAYFAVIASYGVSVFVSSGDNGAFDSNFNRSVSSPASDPSVTAVGGTSIDLNASTGATSAETAWTATELGDFDSRIGASGGGISGYFPHPSWQAGNNVPTGYTRMVPDVASSADQKKPGYLVFTNSSGTQLAGGYANGTSWAAPTWAGICALLNEARGKAGLATVGFLNPKIYPLSGTGSFRDITQGDNQYPGFPGYGWDAKAGYDMVTGLGSPNLANLVAALAPSSKPVITSAKTVTGYVNKAFSYQIAATNNPTSYGAASLPSGLAINQTTGKITGTPKTAGTYKPVVAAFNGSGSGSATLTLTVVAPPKVTSTTAATGHTNSAFTYQITATNSPTSYGAAGLPGGLAINQTTGKITGKPTKVGTFSATVAAFNAAGSGTAKLTITVNAAPVITSATTGSATTGQAFTYQIAATNSPTSYGAAGMPPGLSINQTTGKISGTPTKAGTYSMTVAAFNASGSGSAKVTVTVKAPAPVITSAKTASGKSGTAFTYQITATNSPTSYGAAGLPGGLTINQTTGKISGTPTSGGSYTATIAAFNSGGSGSATLTFAIQFGGKASFPKRRIPPHEVY